MATCKCCDKKLGLLVGSNKLSDEYDEQCAMVVSINLKHS